MSSSSEYPPSPERQPSSERPLEGSQLEAHIAEEIARLQAECYGTAPKKARAYVTPGEIVVVVLRETFTPAEKVLIGHGDAEMIQHSRRRFQQLSREDFVAVVEQATGEQVEAFLSETNLEREIAVEMFLLAGKGRTEMEGFEQSHRSDTETPMTPSSANETSPGLGTDEGRRPDGQAHRDSGSDNRAHGGGRHA